MIRKTFIALAVAAMVVSVSAPAFAGGRSGGGGGKSNYTVRVKNNGSVANPAYVTVTQGTSPTAAGGKTLPSGGVGQWSVKKGQFVVGAWESSTATAPLGQQLFNAGPARLIYALAAINTTEGVATVTGSTGQKF